MGYPRVNNLIHLERIIIVSSINNSKVFILALEQCICLAEGGDEQRKRKLSDAAAATPEPKEQKNKTIILITSFKLKYSCLFLVLNLLEEILSRRIFQSVLNTHKIKKKVPGLQICKISEKNQGTLFEFSNLQLTKTLVLRLNKKPLFCFKLVIIVLRLFLLNLYI